MQNLTNEFGDYFKSKIDKIRDNFIDDGCPFDYDGIESDIEALSTFKELDTDSIKSFIAQSPSKSCCLDPIPT